MNRRLEHSLRVTGRLLWFAAELCIAAGDYAWTCGMGRRPLGLTRAEWLHRTSRRLMKVFSVELNVFGPVPASGLLVCNHLSYLDILVLGALFPSVFVAKSEVKAWPILGWFARLAGTIFVERRRRAHARQSADEIEKVLRKGALVVLFPEGTSSGGQNILPFKSSLLEPATRQEHRITAGHIRYDLPGGNVSQEVCYWNDMTLFPHLVNLLGKRAVRAAVAFCEVHHGSLNRKELARLLHSEVVRLSQGISV